LSEFFLASRTLVIGDIHGCLAQFDTLLESLAPTTEDHLILLGDYIDRGSDSSGVLNRILKLSAKCRLTALMGNHEQMMLAARDSREKLSDWLLNGGDATLKSYAGVRSTLRDIPNEHWQFLTKSLVAYVETDTHIFVHANVSPDLPMDEQPDYMLRWERCDKILPHESGKIIVCGHTPQLSGAPLNRGYAVCIDTNVYGGGPLTCMETNSGRIWQADGAGHIKRAHISDF